MDSERKKQIAFGAGLSYLIIAAKLLSGIIYTPIVLHSLGKSEYGVYSLCVSFTSYLTIFNAGINAAYIRFYVQAREKGNHNLEKLNGIFLEILFVLGILGMLLGLVAGKNAEVLFGVRILPDEYIILKKSLYILSVTIFFSSINGFFSSVIIAHERFIAGKLVELLHTVCSPVFTIPFLIAGYGTVSILMVNLGLIIVMFFFYLIYSIKELGVRFELQKAEKGIFRSILIFAGFIVVQSVMDQLNWQVDKYILARFQGADEVAVYSVGSLFNSYYITITTAVAGVFIAEINRLVANGENEEILKLFIKTARIFSQIAVFIMSAYIIFGKPFIARWSGKEYGDSYYVGLLIMFPVTFSLSQGLGQDIARAKNLHKTQIIINIVVCMMNFLVSIPLAKYYGAIGSAFGTFVCEIFICIFIQGIYYQKIVKLDMRAYYKEIISMFRGWLLPFIVGFEIYSFGIVKENYASIMIYGILYAALYVGSVWMLALSPYEKEMVQKMVKKLVWRNRKQNRF